MTSKRRDWLSELLLVPPGPGLFAGLVIGLCRLVLAGTGWVREVPPMRQARDQARDQARADRGQEGPG